MAKVEDENYVSDTSSEGEGNLEQNHRKVEVQRRRRLVQKKIQFGKKNVQTKGVGEHSHVRCPITRSSAQKKRFSQKNAMERNGDANGKRKVKYPDDIDSDFEVEQCVPVDEEESEDSSEANKSVLRRSKGNTHRHKSSCSEFEDEDARNKHQREHKLLILTKIVAIYVDKQIMPLLDWELLFPNSRALVVKIINSNDNSRSTTPIADIKRLLSNDQLEVFRNSAFGKFIDLPHYKIQNQLVNLISLREVHQPRLDEMWFDFGGKIMRFGVEEFAVISGLNCNGLCKKLCYPPVPDGLFDRYFANVGLNRQSIKCLFLNRAWINDHDGVKLAKLHLLANFLMGAQDNLLFDRCFLDILDSQDCDNYPWGKEVYDYTLDYLKMSSRNKESLLQKLDGTEKRVYLYRIRGFILSLQVWFYEVCDSTDGVICTRLSVPNVPRMLNWEAHMRCGRRLIQRVFLTLPSDKFKNITPTESEKTILQLDGFFVERNEFIRNESQSTPTFSVPGATESPFIGRLNELSSNQVKIMNDLDDLKKLFTDFSTKVMHEILSLKETMLHEESGKQQDLPHDVDNQDISRTGLNDGEGAKPNDVPESSRHQENVGIHKEVDAEDFVQGNGEHNVDFDVDGFPVLTPQMMDEIDRTTEGKLKSMLTANKNDTPGVIGGLDIGIQGNQNVDDLVSVVDIPFKKIKRVKKRQVICKSCPFDTDFWDTMRFDLTSDFFEWLKVGKLKNRRKKKEGFVYYDKKNTTLSPPFDFNVDVVSDKNWFFTLYESNCFLDGSHIDVLFYYIRKIGLYALEPPSQKFTTTDNFFDQQMKSLYSLYIVNSCDPRICTIDSVIVDYMFGFKILCGESWLDVDYVLFPIHVELEGVGHWILGRLSFATRKLMIYNSYRSTDFDQVVLESVKRYSILIPIFLAMVNFVSRRADIKKNIGPYSGKAENDPLDVIFVEDLPQQLFCDCGVFVASFAEYIVSNEPINAATFDVDIERSRFSYLLYTHGKMKQEKDSESDDDSPGLLPANYRSMLVLPYTK
ncbi:hypothetical protein STAS_16689 [Striga asiatica]|uniref:Ubiquitin-like protease family profile domain-containing protein n=1 Tax=Striga asiatica TaxID=4170 RepID=A0A5A7Q4C0_STRAF|nr:hypothetical protein STAS_16689 [Striga asiatica]